MARVSLNSLAVAAVVMGACGALAAACSTSAASGTGCQTLTSCCATLTGAEEQACISAAAMGNAAACSSQLTTYQTLGLCAAHTGSGTGTGSSTHTTTGTQSNSTTSSTVAPMGCGGLAACCAKLPASEESSCIAVVAAGVTASCNASLGVYQSNGMCVAVGPGLDGGVDATVDAPIGSQGTPSTCSAAAAARSYIGCDFWPTVTANLVASIFDFTAVIANLQPVPVSIMVTGPGGFATTVTAAPNSLTDVYLPWVQALKGPDVSQTSQEFLNSVSVRGGAYHLVSTLPVAVYQFNALEYQGVGGPPGKDWSTCPVLGGTGCFSYSNDATVLFPSTSMTGNYRVTGEHGSTTLTSGGIISITATASGTTVTVTLSTTAAVVASAATVTTADGGTASAGDAGVIPAANANTTMHFNMNAGDVVELMGTATDTVDLSGSLVQATKPIQVIAARQCADQPDPIAACDHLESSVFPAETLGKNYVVTVPTSPNATVIGHKVRFYGNVDGTLLTYSPTQPTGCPSTINAGQVVECLSNPSCATGTSNSGTNQGDPVTVACTPVSFEVTGTHEFAVSSFMLGGSAVDPNGSATSAALGDPSMSPIVATEQYRSQYDFLAPTDYAQSYADVVIPAGTALTLDGNPVTVTPTPLNATWSIVRITLTAGQAGAHVISGTRPFGIQVIGYGAYTSYQYPAGLDLAEIAPPPSSN